ncbi:acyloxyacyl hydrolase [Sphingomonas sp. R1]|uniref:acyloxyacyl hydrolase n=1 Tax=Sphingomonas sp. R1 TaxID=399176 RepID=UPI002223F27E|nr:acyloxyacyl hydrolase [Sphingomonas sp. R1]UYY77551.1 acyloxyacyl hydrolase [Sphingomonas sp. R1]
MIGWKEGAVGAALALAPVTAVAQQVGEGGPAARHTEIAIGVFQHGSNFHPLGSQLTFNLPELPPGYVYEGQEEDGTTDVEIAYRSRPLRILLKPRLTGKLQINTDGRTSFGSIGAEWRQHFFRDRIYVQGGIGLTVIDGYRFTPDPFQPGLSQDEAQRRYTIYRRRTSFGSTVLFNPNASIGVRLTPKWAVELAWEHYSHRQLFSDTNPGMDSLGVRLVHRFGR